MLIASSNPMETPTGLSETQTFRAPLNTVGLSPVKENTDDVDPALDAILDPVWIRVGVLTSLAYVSYLKLFGVTTGGLE